MSALRTPFRASFDGFDLDSERGLYFGEVAIPLPPKELGALLLLVRRSPSLVTKQDLIREVWGGAPASDESIARCLSVVRSRLRRALPAAGAFIETEYGRGYRFVGHVTGAYSLSAQTRLCAQVMERSQEAIMITDADNRILSINPAFTRVTGYTAEEVVGHDPAMLASGRHGKEFFQAMWQCINTEGNWRGEIWDRRKNGEVYPKWLEISVVRDETGAVTHYIALFSDITERRTAEAQVEFLAYHDPLTRLPNRLMLKDRFERAAALAKRQGSLVGLLHLDLDQFRHINNSFGHGCGDQLLLNVTRRLAACVRDTDSIGRLGADEFLFLLSGLRDVDMASVVAQKLIDSLAEPFRLQDREIGISASIGISLCPFDGGDFDTLLKKADAATYYAKDCGGNTYRYYTEQMNVNALEKLQMRSDLQRALKNGEFLLHYQPQFDLESGRMVGVEALLRWDCEARGGLVPPGQFIPVAEDSGFIVPIGEWVLREACRQNKAWQDAGYAPFMVAVNLSGVQFRRGNVARTVAAALEETGLEPQWLELELTESILVQDAEQVLETVRELDAMGVQMSIDDFGTGYSSLAYLKRFNVDTLKIDQSFVRNLQVDPGDAAIVHSVIHLGHGMKLRVIAEGVEAHEQVELLKHAGCDRVQGYYFSQPLPADEVIRFAVRAGQPHAARNQR